MQFHRPETIDAALGLLAEGSVTMLAGGTDFFPARAGRTADGPVLDLSRVSGLKGITKSDDTWRIGATTTWSQIRDADLPSQFTALQLAAREVGSIQIQNAGTIAGNICNASPAADGVPPLLAMAAAVEVAGPNGRRTVPLDQFITGVRSIALHPGEMVTAVIVPDRPAERACFLKLGARRYLVISMAMVAANVSVSMNGTLDSVSIAVGACSPVARRIETMEKALIGLAPGSTEFADAIQKADLSVLTPIDDVRATAAYRLDAVRTLIGRAVSSAAQEKE